MTVSLNVMTLGEGYRYLTNSVVSGDVPRTQVIGGRQDGSSPLTRYYAEAGTPPGRWVGAALPDIAQGQIGPGDVVSEAQLGWLLGMLRDPVTKEPLGRRQKDPPSLASRIARAVEQLPEGLSDTERATAVASIETAESVREANLRRPVAGFDLTFSAPKSVSAAWAVADEQTRQVITDAMHEATATTLAWAEEHVFHTRTGTNGVVQENVNGVIAAAFDHWDSRANDPHLHTHVVVANRAKGADGKWRTLDSRAIFKSTVTLSEMHEGVVHDLLTARLGWGWTARTRAHSDRPRWDVDGVPDTLIEEFSQRSAAIEEATNRLIAEYVEAHGRRPDNATIAGLRQRATLQTRPDKQHPSLEELVTGWRERAHAVTGMDHHTFLSSLTGRDVGPITAAVLTPDLIDADAAAILHVVGNARATFTAPNVRAEAHRRLHHVVFTSPAERIEAVETLTRATLAKATQLNHLDPLDTPDLLRREDGTSRFVGVDTTVYAAPETVKAEEKLLDRARRTAPELTVTPGAVARVAEENLPGKDYRLGLDQAVAVEQVATSGRVLDVLVGPAGAGKTTMLAGLKAAWESEHGPGSVVGIAPSAAAADVLAEDLQIDTDNLAKWLHELDVTSPERTARIDRLESIPRRTATQQDALDALREQQRRWSFTPGQLVIIDESSLAGTLDLDRLTHAATKAGAKVLLVGDHAQLGAVDTGGAFAMLTRDRGHTLPQLTDVRRFRNEWERDASLLFRRGDHTAVAAYADRGRIHGGTRDEALDALYRAWAADTAAGKTSLMIAADTDTVRDLNARAHADLTAAGHVTGPELPLATGEHAAAGDLIVTRRNDRTLPTGGRGWVKNGDVFRVRSVHDDGSLTVAREGSHGLVTLPPEYAAQHVQLGYAVTAHRSQGRTVDTAHAYLDATTSREVAYVAATRGRHANNLFLDVEQRHGDPEAAHGPALTTTPQAVLATVLDNATAETSAHDTAAAHAQAEQSLAVLKAQYEAIAQRYEQDHWDQVIASIGLTPEQVHQVASSPARGPLVAGLRHTERGGYDPRTVLARLKDQAPLTDADDVAAVLTHRLRTWTSTTPRGASDTTDPGLVLGVVPRGRHVTDPAARAALDQREQAMTRAADRLVNDAIARGDAWLRDLGPVGVTRAQKAHWLGRARVAAARLEVHGAAPSPQGTAPSTPAPTPLEEHRTRPRM